MRTNSERAFQMQWCKNSDEISRSAKSKRGSEGAEMLSKRQGNKENEGGKL